MTELFMNCFFLATLLAKIEITGMNSKPEDEWKLNTLIELKKFTNCKRENLLQKIKSDGGVYDDDDDETSNVDRKSPTFNCVYFKQKKKNNESNHDFTGQDYKTKSLYNMDTDSSNIEKLA